MPPSQAARRGTRFFVTEDPPKLVGWGQGSTQKRAFVEHGYEIAEARQGEGLATAATRAMVAEAIDEERLSAVIAHTLAERNASNRIQRTPPAVIP